MNIFEEMNDNEIADAVSFFPALKDNAVIQEKPNTNIQRLIKKQTALNNKKDKSKILTHLIDKFFDLKKYDSLKDMSLPGWAAQFIFRKNIINNLKHQNPYIKEPTELEYDIQSRIFQLLRNPIFNFSKYPLMFFDTESISSLNKFQLHNMAEKHLRAGVFESITNTLNFLDDDKENHITNDEFELFTSPAGDLLSLDGDPTIIVAIDLSINDDKLKEDFSEYLSKKRKELGIKPYVKNKFKKGKIKSLTDNRVLQYMDLKILDLYINKSDTLKQNNMADYIFPDASADKTEKIRKSTIPYVNEIIDGDIIDSMLMELKKIYPYPH